MGRTFTLDFPGATETECWGMSGNNIVGYYSDGSQYRASDDGEPAGSAGKPILGQIDSLELTNTLVVVVRYFGGSLLGVPGLSLFIFGQYFNRHEAWGELARGWVDYMARNALMLQQGRNVADVA